MNRLDLGQVDADAAVGVARRFKRDDFGLGLRKQTVDGHAVEVGQPLQPGDVPETYADTAELQAATGFKPATPIEVGVRRFVDWYRSYYANSAR